MDIYLKALGFIFLAEMGDKTQVLAMVLATRYKLKDVLLGIFIGSFLNHGIAIFLGMGIMRLVPIKTVQLIAGGLFILFAYWTLKYDSDEEEEEKSISRIPMIAVAVLFFVGELGDKTQLTAVTLAVDNRNAFITLLGTTSGMLLTSGIGIALGLKFGSMIQEHMIKYGSSAIFLIYGLIKLGSMIEESVINTTIVILAMVVYSFLFRRYYVLARTDQVTAFQKAAASLHSYRESMEDNVEIACHGEKVCSTCTGKHCSIGYLKYLVTLLHEENKELWVNKLDEIDLKEHNRVQKNILKESLLLTLNRLYKEETIENFDTKNEIRKTIETILYGNVLQNDFNKETYIADLKIKDRFLANKLQRIIND